MKKFKNFGYKQETIEVRELLIATQAKSMCTTEWKIC